MPDVTGELRFVEESLPDEDFRRLDMPDWLTDYTQSLVVRTPSVTIDMRVRAVAENPFFEAKLKFFYDEYVVEGGEGDQNPVLEPDLLSLKRYDDDPEVYRVIDPLAGDDDGDGGG